MNGRYNRGGYQQNGRTYPQRGRGGGGNFQRRNNQQQQRAEGDYLPNSGKMWPNSKARSDRDPAFSGIMNIEITADMLRDLRPGDRLAFFVSGWENNPGDFRLSFNPAGYQQQQQQPQGRRQNGYRGGYDQAPMDDYQPRQNGAMSRARAIPEPQYYDEAPPHDQIPDGPNQYEEAPY